MIRMFGLPESGLADTLRDAEEGIDGYGELEITTCLRRGEIEMVTRFEPAAAGCTRSCSSSCASATSARSSPRTAPGRRPGRALLVGRRIATAESCTAGLLAARLTERPGSSAYVTGGVVAYSNEAKVDCSEVDPALIERHGAVSEPVADAMAGGRAEPLRRGHGGGDHRNRRPGRGTEEKPVGTVCWSVKLADGRGITRTIRLPGDRIDIRDRSTTVAMHLLRRVLSEPAPSLNPQPPRGATNEPVVHAPGCSWRSTCPTMRGIGSSGGATAPRWAPRLRPVRPEALHVTLVFLGWQDESAAEPIAEAAFGSLPAAPPPRLTATVVRPVPPRNARLFALDLDDEEGRATALQGAMSDALEAGGWYRPEKRPFWPHMTLARVKRGERRVAPPADEPAPPGSRSTPRS